jgi:hypothetical protein
MNNPNNQKIIIFADHTTNRLLYTVHYVFDEVLGLQSLITNNVDEFLYSSFPKICYSNPTNDFKTDAITIFPYGLLYQTNLDCEICPGFEYLNDMPVLFRFPVPSTFEVEFDIFSAIFFLISRYEEYTNKEFDNHGRYISSNSILYRHHLNLEPVVDVWINYLKEKLTRKYPEIKFNQEEFKYLPTVDIDWPFRYKYRNLVKTAGGLVKSAIKMRFDEFVERNQVIFWGKTDPYYTFDYLNDMFSKYTIKAIYFYLCSNSSKFDCSHSYTNKALQEMVLKNEKFAFSGLHNSYKTLENGWIIAREKKLLENIVNHPVNKSRFHFLRFQLPQSFKNIMTEGITEDYSMGYPDLVGFRAGTCHPFYFYDLLSDEKTPLKVIPFQAMDAAYIYNLKKSPADFLVEMHELKQKVKQYSGTLVIIWHNNTFAPTTEGFEWRKVFEEMLKA